MRRVIGLGSRPGNKDTFPAAAAFIRLGPSASRGRQKTAAVLRLFYRSTALPGRPGFRLATRTPPKRLNIQLSRNELLNLAPEGHTYLNTTYKIMSIVILC